MRQVPHRRSRRTRAIGATAAILALALPAAAQTPAAVRSVANGVFTAAQAAQGDHTFRTICGNCHAISQFNGPSFRKVWSGRTVYDLFDQLRNTMPLDNPGGLSREDYAAVIAYLLQLNEFPAGATPLPATDDELKRVRF